jgi:hypothetical protein
MSAWLNDTRVLSEWKEVRIDLSHPAEENTGSVARGAEPQMSLLRCDLKFATMEGGETSAGA